MNSRNIARRRRLTEQNQVSGGSSPEKKVNPVWRWLKRIALLLLLLAVAAGLFIGYKLWGPVVTSDDLTALSEENIQGPINAPVKIVEFGDFGCPACRRWHQSGIKQKVMEMFGDQVSFTYRHFPVISEHGTEAAIAAQCAGEQGAFWTYHDYLFEKAEGLTVAELENYAEALGLSTRSFETCMQSDEMREYVERDQRSAFREGARGTPAFFVNGRLVYNPSLEELQSLVQDVQ
jgi:protein-disulfide isomerase